MIAVDGGGYDTACESFVSGNQRAASAYDRLTRELARYRAMAGNDSTSDDFAASYDDAVQQAVHALADLVASFAGLGRITHASVTNHREANARSVIGGAQVYVGGPLPAGGCVEVLPSSPPSSLGGDSPDLPPHVGWILDHVAGFVWPGADADRLREAARTWHTAAESLDIVAIYCDAAVRALWDERSPEVPLAVDATHELRAHVRDLAAHFVSLGSACEAYADQVDATRERTLALAEWLLEQVVEGDRHRRRPRGDHRGRWCGRRPRRRRRPSRGRVAALPAPPRGAAGTRRHRGRRPTHHPRGPPHHPPPAREVHPRRGRARRGGHGSAGRRQVATGLAAIPRALRQPHARRGTWAGPTLQLLTTTQGRAMARAHASTFTGRRARPSRAIARALNHARPRRSGSGCRRGKRRLELDAASSRIVGRCAGAEWHYRGCARHLRVILVRDASMPDGYRILHRVPGAVTRRWESDELPRG